MADHPGESDFWKAQRAKVGRRGPKFERSWREERQRYKEGWERIFGKGKGSSYGKG